MTRLMKRLFLGFAAATLPWAPSAALGTADGVSGGLGPGVRDHDECNPHEMSEQVSGEVNGENPDDYWGHSPHYPIHFFYLFNSGDADLYVYGDEECSDLLCSSENPQDITDSCGPILRDSTIYLQVHLFSAPFGGGVSYILKGCHTPLIATKCHL